jgi:prolyl oligopeptidase
VLLSVITNVKGKALRMTRTPGDGKPVWKAEEVVLPQDGAIQIISSNRFTSKVFLTYEGFITPESLYLVDENVQAPRLLKTLPAKFDARGLTVRQWEARSKDGTRIPYFVIGPEKLPLDGTSPTVLYGYGGFEIPLLPSYLSVSGKLWVERGGVYVVANIRGGGEFGPKWHQAALKAHRQRAYDDFLAVAEDLIARKVTSPEHLGILGGSNGGLLVGVAFTERPDLFKGVVCLVPLLDMLRYTKLSAGPSWAAEYGDPDDPEMRAVLAKYSPYQNVKPGVKYPEVFFMTSTEDDRVNPAHARKMVAKMSAMGDKVFYFENTEGGHGAAANLLQRARRYALQYVYFHEMLFPQKPAKE